MTGAQLEHVNVTVPDAEATAELLCELFDWKIRWKGEAIHGGRSVHVGSRDSYVALYSPAGKLKEQGSTYKSVGAMNHIGVTVDDLDATETRVRQAGFEPYSHADYEPGRRFYFRDGNHIEIEVVSYA
jgi:catechol 2,3-dioxygenase-like lactoylglutathione lyase family enzyme